MGKRWLVGVSGGRDSVALLHACIAAGLRDLVVAHIHHGLRGKAADDDARFVADLADQFQLPYFRRDVDVPAVAEREQKGLELVAREQRHLAFRDAIIEHGCDGVLLGHHADDQAETVLHNLLRGADGLKGMHLEKDFWIDGVNLRFVRPMLHVRRAGIDAYIATHRLDFREDTTNAEPFTVRNRIRNELMPLLESIMQRDAVPGILHAHLSVSDLDDFLSSQIHDEEMLDPQGRLFLPNLQQAHRAVQLRVLHRYLGCHGISDLSRAVVESCLTLCEIHGRAKVNLPGGHWMRRKEKRLFIEKAESE